MDDFQFVNDRSALVWLLPGSNGDLTLTTNIVLDPVATEEDFLSFVSYENAWKGRSLNFTMSPLNLTDTANLDLHLPLGRMWEFWDISTMSALSFMAKGEGTVRLYLEVASSDKFSKGDIGWEISLTDSWQEQKLTISALTNNGNSISINEIKEILSAVTAVGFKLSCNGTDTIHFQADNIKLLDIEALDLLN